MQTIRIDAPNDGSHDATEAFNNAVVAAGYGGTVIVPPGDYLLSWLVIDQAKQHWQFEHGARLIRSTQSVDALLTVAAPEVEISSANIDCMMRDPVSGYGWGILVTKDGTGAVLEDCMVRDCTHMGIVPCASGVTVRRCRVESTRQIGIFAYLGYLSVDADGPTITDCIVDQTELDSDEPTGGIFVRGDVADDCRWNEAHVANNKVCLPYDPNYPQVAIELINCDRCLVRGNHVKGGYIGLSLGECRDAVISANTCYAPNQIGIEVAQGSCDCVVESNTVDGVGILRYGIQVSGPGNASDCNVIANNSVRRVEPTNGECVSIINCLNTTVTGNKLRPGSAKAGIYAQSTPGYPSLLAITGNLITGDATATYGVQLDTPVGCNVSGNMISSCANGVRLQCATPTQLSANLVGNNVFVAVPTPISLSLLNGATLASSNRLVSNVGYLRNGRAADMLNVAADMIDVWGSGSPEGSVAAGPGSIYRQQDGGSTIYKKVSGLGVTGWQAL